MSFQYDPACRLVSALVTTRLAQVSDYSTGTLAPLASYSYEALGRRVSKTISSAGLPPVTTQFIYDGDGVIEERSAGVVAASFVLDATRSHDDQEIQMRRGGQDYYLHTDDQGNVLALTTTGGTVVERYDAWILAELAS